MPAADPRIIDVAFLDMHHGWPNLGHEALVDVVQSAVCDLRDPLARAGLNLRVLSYDVRRGHVLPEGAGGRHAIYVGTGGPGHLDPRCNDGREGSQGIVEDPAWEAPLFALFDSVRADAGASLFAVCHAFGVMCRWLGVADAVLRDDDPAIDTFAAFTMKEAVYKAWSALGGPVVGPLDVRLIGAGTAFVAAMPSWPDVQVVSVSAAGYWLALAAVPRTLPTR